MIWNRILYRLGTCFHDPFLPALSQSRQSCPLRRVKGTLALMELLWTSCPGWGQERWAWLSSATQWPREVEAVGCSDQVRGACQRAAVVCEGQNEAEGEKTESGEWRKAMGFSVYLQLFFLMGGWEKSWGHCPEGGLQPCPALAICSL